MSILNMPSDGLFNVLIVLVRALVRFGPKSRDELLASCGANVSSVEPKQLNQTLNRWMELGLFELEADQVRLNEVHTKALGKKPDVAELKLPGIIRSIALRPENNLRFWESEGNRSADLNRGLSWILAQDIYTIDTGSHERIQKLENEQIADLSKRIFQNDTRWNGLRTWMVYLGFGRTGARMTVDPTVAVRDELPQIFKQDTTLPASIFVERASEIVPVLDRGKYRVEMEAVLNPASWAAPSENQISTSLSRAIQRLDREGFIATEQRADSVDGGITLIGSGGRQWRSVTHIRRLPENGDK
ncbi:protein DpdG [Brucella anthropi]|uniref:protein DpdG n=1 Tax=Brucella anthropi TaxID=529 RepID=UPI00244CC826|nr:protein DpdG [Brucella anthropi]MDG9793528.1 protein DpdG [Brucella anthropi]MDH0583359.1 protein DpdG [Brucella anthropi]MDH0819929.1 protein DpdG [Brucella anthropi]MDH2086720.1 protein DpdG [Brucella anthropi]